MADIEQPPELQPVSDPLGRSHQLRVDIAVSLSLLPGWLRRALADRNPEKARAGRADIVERIASSLERRFRITWLGSEDADENARPPARPSPLFGAGKVAQESHESSIGESNAVDSRPQSGGT